MAGQVNVKRMLRSLSPAQMEEWKHYYELEPFGLVGDSNHTALIVKAIYDAAGMVKKGTDKQFDLEDLLLWGKPPRVKVAKEEQRQSVQTKIAIAHAIATAFSGVKGKDK